MELPNRPKGDQFTPAGHYRELESQVRRRAQGADTPVLFVYAFDFRTRLGPFLFVDKSLIPGAPRAVASALHAAGFTNLRVVLQQWSPRVRPSLARIGGKSPEMLFVSSMQIHSASAYRLIRDAWRLGASRPLIVAGGPKAIYEPWDFFGLSPDGREGADIVVTGEEFVILQLLDRILEFKSPGETMRAAFDRARQSGHLEDIPGLVYRPDSADGPPPYLINTGIQRLVQDLDELPLPFNALGLFEPPHQRATLAHQPIPAARLGRHAYSISMVTTRGCKFHCGFCPIPAYNQHTFRHRGPERLVEEMTGTAQRSGIAKFFGTDDNFFNDRQTAEAIFTAMARGKIGQRPFRDAVWFATEATEFDAYKNRDLLPLARDAGLRGLWFGIEDMTAELVKKGQSPEKTSFLFKLLTKLGIAPMPMMVYHDGQPLWSWRGLYGLLNQIRFLRRAGALTCQVTLLTPIAGAKTYEETFDSGAVLKRVGNQPVEDYQFDGNHCVATQDPHPWHKQLNLLASYASFYNPLNLLRALPKIDSLWGLRLSAQVFGMLGMVKSLGQLRDWVRRLVSGPIERFSELPRPKFRMVVPDRVALELVHYGEGIRLPSPS